MKQILIELDDETAKRLEQVAPARSRQRSGFIRAAIARALSDLEEQSTRAAYRKQPDAGDDAYFDPRVWEPEARYRKRERKRR
jgi:predicted transcriptional regulator